MERKEAIEILDAGKEGPVIGPETIICCITIYGFYYK